MNLKRVVLVAFSLVTCISVTTLADDYNDRVIIERSLKAGGSFELTYFKNGRYYKSTDGEEIKLEEDLRKSSSNILQLQFLPNEELYDSPTGIEGVKEDIPFNYFSDLESSSEYIYSLLGNGWNVLEYTAGINTIYFELTKDGELLRIIVYEDYLKVYKSKGVL